MRYLDKSIEELHELLKSNTIKPIDLVEEAFARIEEKAHRLQPSLCLYSLYRIAPF